MHMCMLEAGRAVAQHDATQLERASADDVARRFWLLCDSGVACERCGLELRHRGAAYVVDDHERRSGRRRRPPHADGVLALLQGELEQAQRLRLQQCEHYVSMWRPSPEAGPPLMIIDDIRRAAMSQLKAAALTRHSRVAEKPES